jgi:hypothetical protein
MLHDKQCTDGNVAFRPEYICNKLFFLLCHEPYKHPTTTKLNLNTTKEKGDGNKLSIPSSLELLLKFQMCVVDGL